MKRSFCLLLSVFLCLSMLIYCPGTALSAEQPRLVFGSDGTGTLASGEIERVYLENTNDLAIAGVAYSTDNEKVEVDEFGNLTVKEGAVIGKNETVTVTAQVSYYDEEDVIFADGFEGEKKFTTGAEGYTHSSLQSVYGRYSATPANVTAVPTKSFDAVTDVTVTAWFYDSNVRINNQKFGVGITTKNYIGLFYSKKESGYVGGKLATNYAIKVPGITYQSSAHGATDVERSEGWHQFQWIYDQQKGLTVKIDGEPITTNASVSTTAANNTETVKIENFAVADPTVSSVNIVNGNGGSIYTWPTIQNQFFIDNVSVVKNNATVQNVAVTSAVIPLESNMKELSLVYGADPAAGLKKGESERVYLENTNNYAIADVTYSTDNEKVAVDEFGNISIKPGTVIEDGETVTVTAKVSCYDEKDVIFADGFEGEKKFTTGAEGYTHSSLQSVYGRYSATPANVTAVPTKSFDAVTDVTVTAWFYDSNVRINNQKFGVGITSDNYIGLFYSNNESGYVGGKLATNYAIKVPGITYQSHARGATDVERSEGWHQFQWIYDQQKGLTVKIDGKPITTNASVSTTAANNTETVKIENFAVADPTVSSVNIVNGNGGSIYTWPTIQNQFFIDGVTVVKNDAAVLTYEVSSQEIPLDNSLNLVYVEGGSGNGGYAPEEIVTVRPDLPEEGKAFVKWEVEGIELADPAQYKVQFEMPANDVIFRAVFEETAETPTYPLTVINGSGSGSFEADSLALIEADPAPKGKAFYKWESEDIVINAAYSPKIKVVVPTYGGEIKAIYTDARACRDFYLNAENGNDEADGKTPETAWKSLAMMDSFVMQPGDRVLLKAGSVFEEALVLVGNGSEDAPIIVDMYNGSLIGKEAGERPHIKADGRYTLEIAGVGERSYALYAESISHLSISNLELSNYSSEKQQAIAIAVTNTTGCTVKDIHLDNLYVHDVNGDVQSKLTNGGIDVSAPCQGSRFDGVLVENCTVKNVCREGIRVTGSGDSQMWAGHGGYYPAEIIEKYAGTNVVVRNNYIENSGGDAIVLGYWAHPLVEYNISNGASLNTKDNSSLQYNAAIWPWRCQNAVFQFNEVYNTYLNGDGQAFDCDYSENTTYQYNYSHDNEGGFMLVCKDESVGGVIRYNISQNDLRSLVDLCFCPSSEFYNNTFYVGEGLNTDIIRHNGSSVFTNNIFYNLGTKTSPTWGNNTTYDNNLYYGYETTPEDANKIIADPMFVDPGKGGTGVCGDPAIDTLGGYALQVGSPAIDAGKLIENNGGRDYAGTPLRKHYVSIGAMEFAFEQGDISLNGTVDTSDVVTLLQSLVGHECTTPQSVTDVNDDGRVSVYDAVTLIRLLAQ